MRARLFPSDHVIADERTFRETLNNGIAIAAGVARYLSFLWCGQRAETGMGTLSWSSRKLASAPGAPIYGKPTP